MTGEQVIDFMVGQRPPDRPTTPDVALWRSYLVRTQGERLKGDISARPSTVFPTVLAQVRGEFLQQFPGQDALADQIFTPQDPAPPAVGVG